MTETANKKMGAELAEAAAGAGFTGATAKKQKEFIHFPYWGEKILSDSKYCSNCVHNLT